MSDHVLPAFITVVVFISHAAAAGQHPLSDDARRRMAREFDEAIAESTKRIAGDSKTVENYSRRGDAHFFRGRFSDAVADYDRMIELEPEMENQHWRRGIACFYAGQFDKAARQFERYHTFDSVDRENGIWRYLSQLRSVGRDKAREGLLKYEKDDREPFRDVYWLFAGKIEPDAILEKIRTADVSDQEREKRLFYAHLYIGLNHAVEDQPQLAVPHLQAATAAPWPREAGYGPRYMWHVGRLHLELLLQGPAEG